MDNSIQGHLKQAVNLLYQNDGFLLEINAHEIAITHKLAEYVQQKFPNYHVDCEYNREGDTDETKALRGLTECENIDSREKERWIRPDILVHERGINCRNLLALEVKLEGGGNRGCDRAKLRELSKDNHDFRYQHALFIELPTGQEYEARQITVESFEDGGWTDLSEAFN